MPLDAAYRPCPRIELLGEGFFDVVTPARFPRATLRYRNQPLAARLGLGGLDDAAWEAAFARFEPLLCNLPKPLALRYHGHQFGSYNPDLGDGRGFLFAQLIEPASGTTPARLLDLGTKGSGRTPWSRGGDGRLTLKGGVREILATEMLETLGVPTSRTLSLFETGEALHRGDEPSPTRSSVLVRASHAHLRFGTFQRFAALEDAPRLAKLLRYAARHYGDALPSFDGAPHLDPDGPLPELATALLARTAEATARMVAAWTAAGFVHGVLNTDNFTITGESFDYGPWRFLPTLDPAFVAAYFDHAGRYAFGEQPAVGRWNLARLGDALSVVAPRAALADAEARYDDAFPRALGRAVARRLGLRLAGEGARGAAGADASRAALAEATLAHLAATQAPFERFFFDAHGLDAARLAASPSAPHAAGATFDAILRAAEPFERDPAAPAPAGAAPETLLLDDVEALWAAIDRDDDFGPLEAKVARLRAARAQGAEGAQATSAD